MTHHDTRRDMVDGTRYDSRYNLSLRTMLPFSPVLSVDKPLYRILYPYALVRILPLSWFHSPAQLVMLDEQFGSGLPADNIPAPVPVFNLPLPAPASHGHGMFQQLPAKHLFGPAQTMDAGYFGPDEMAMMDMPFPNDRTSSSAVVG